MYCSNVRRTAQRVLLLLLLRLLSLSTVLSAANEESSPVVCFPDCGPFGSCVFDPNVCGDDHHCMHGTCQCLEGFTGKDCSLRAPDICHVSASPAQAELLISKCLNGGVCIERKSEGNRVWAICKCDGAYGASGHSKENQVCSYKVTDVCEEGTVQHSDHAYCYNGGTCLGTIPARAQEPHPGCDCSGTGFAGRHCQFPVESVPIEEEVYVALGGHDIIPNHDINARSKASPSSSYRSMDDDSSTPFKYVLLAIFTLGVFAFVSYGAILQRKRRRLRRREMMCEDHGVELEQSSSSGDDTSWDKKWVSASVGKDRIMC